MAELPSGTVTFLFTDIEGSTHLWEKHRDAMGIALTHHDEILRSAIGAHSGAVFSTGGDGFAVAFARAADALRAAFDIQRAVSSENWPEATPIRVRIGLHTGEVEERGGDYFGPAVNRSARLMAIGHGGQILVSGATEPLVRGALPQEVGLTDLGEHRLRDLSEPIRVFQVDHPGLPSSFPPLRSLDAFLGNLPLQVSPFIGRDRELARVTRALDDARIVTVTGVGGVGKTRLALQVAADVLPRFREGAWLVELAPVRDPEGVVGAFAAVFGVSPQGGQSLREALIDFLRTKQILVVVDNCEHVLDAVAMLVEELERTCAGVAILATSREGLALDGEQNLTLPSLSTPAMDADLDAIFRSESVMLFAQRAQRADADFALSIENAPAVVEVCRRLDGVPLAIELAAARIRAMNPTELAQGLHRRFDTLAGGRRGAVQRHQTLRAAIDWSYDLLSEPEKRLLARLAVFAGGCTREAAQKVCDGDPIEGTRLFDLLVSLVDRSLVVAERDHPETRYRLLETIREYGEERLVEHDETQSLRNRHAEFYMEFARAITEELQGPHQIEAGKRLVPEHENVLAAVNHAIDTENVDLALRLVRYTPSPGSSMGYALLLPVDSILRIDGAAEHSLFAAALAIAGNLAAIRGDLRTAEARCEEALRMAERFDADRDQFVAQTVGISRATIEFALGNHRDAARYAEQAGEIARSNGRLGMAAVDFGASATFHSMAGNPAAAAAQATIGLGLARRVGMPIAIAMNLNALAAAIAEDDAERAKSLLRESKQLRTSFVYETQNEVTQAVFMSSRLGDWSEALELASSSIRHLHWMNSRPQLAGVLNIVARSVASTEPEVAAVLQGAARRLALLAVSGLDSTPVPPARGELTTGRGQTDTGFVAQLRRETTGLLLESLGEVRLHELRSDGEAMDDDHAIAYALHAVAKALALLGE